MFENNEFETSQLDNGNNEQLDNGYNEYETSQLDSENIQPQIAEPVQESLFDATMESEIKKEKKKKTKEKKDRKWLKNIGGGIVFGLCAGAVFLAVAYTGQKTLLKEETKKEVVLEKTDTMQAAPVSDVTEEKSSNTIAQIAQNCMPSVVAITTKSIDEVSSFFGRQQYESEGAGSGIIVGKNDTELLIATNNHVVSGATEVSVCFNDSEDAVVTAKVKGSEAAKDLAVVSIPLDTISDDILAGIKVATIGDSSKLQVGDQVIAIGNALGYGQSVTTGIVSAIDREVSIDDLDVKLIQTDAAINPGNSGGALLNMRGELIGINSAKFASELVEGMGYAIPITTAEPILDNLMNRETRELAGDEAGYLGVTVMDVSDEAVDLYEIPKGAYVSGTMENAAAAQAGIKKGDILVKFDGITISSASDLTGTIAYYKKGEQVEVVYMRADNGAYKETTVTVTLSDKKQMSESQNTQEEMSPQEEMAPPQQEEGSNPGNEYFRGSEGDNFEEFFRYFFGN